VANLDLATPLYRVLMPTGCSTTAGERRSFRRWPKDFSVLHGLSVPDMPCVAVDVNEEGMAFASRVPYRVGSVVHLELQLPSGPIRVQAKVRHAANGMVGAQFLNLSEDDRIALALFCLTDAAEAERKLAHKN
jgi:uncharacterized protein YqjF (DUF2071 family)